MTKIVYNADYGGFGLSDEAIEMYLTRKGLEFTSTDSEYSFSGKNYYVEGNYFFSSDIARDDPILVEVVETLGDKANARFAKLKITDIPEGTLYRIDEYDGYESVMTQEDYEWNVA